MRWVGGEAVAPRPGVEIAAHRGGGGHFTLHDRIGESREGSIDSGHDRVEPSVTLGPVRLLVEALPKRKLALKGTQMLFCLID